MDAETKKLIQEQYAKLPKQLQDAIQSSHIRETITAIGTANKLHIDQMGEFENEVMMLMMGFTDPIEFVGEIQKTLGLNAEASLKIATDTNEQILLPIREKVENVTSDSAPTTATPSTPIAVNTPPISEKSVVMPSAVKAVEPAATPAPAPTVIPTMQTIAEMPKPAGLPMVSHVDSMLEAPTVSIAPKPAEAKPTIPAASTTAIPTPDVKKSDAPAPPPIYKTDPYHEPVD